MTNYIVTISERVPVENDNNHLNTYAFTTSDYVRVVEDYFINSGVFESITITPVHYPDTISKRVPNAD